MKKTILALALASVALAGCSKISSGHVGVKVSQYGSGAGVDPQSYPVGMYFHGPGTAYYEYPVYTQTYVWSKSKHEGKDETDESFSFQDRSGSIVDGDVAISYHADAAKAPALFQKYRTDIEGVIAGPVKNVVRSALSERASNMTVEEIFGPQKTNLINQALLDARKVFEPLGLHIDALYWASAIRIPEAIQNQINAKVANEAAALAAQAQVATAEAVGRAKIAKAEADAKATELEGQALRTNPEILEQRRIEVSADAVRKWKGDVPQTVTGGGNVVPFLNVGPK